MDIGVASFCICVHPGENEGGVGEQGLRAGWFGGLLMSGKHRGAG